MLASASVVITKSYHPDSRLSERCSATAAPAPLVSTLIPSYGTPAEDGGISPYLLSTTTTPPLTTTLVLSMFQ